jgi:hypothetical protein
MRVRMTVSDIKGRLKHVANLIGMIPLEVESTRATAGTVAALGC